MSQFLKQSTAALIMFGPFVDKTDGVTLEVGAGIITSIDHATTGIFLSKNGAAAAIRNQAVTASVLDAYGMFKVTLDTTDTGTVGTLDVLMAEAATFLPVHKSFMVLPANVYDSLMGTDLLDINAAQWLGTACATPTVAGVPEVDVTHLGGVAQSATDLKDFADAGYDPATNKVQGVVLVDTTTANTDMVGTDSAALASVLGAAVGASISADIAAVKVDTAATLTDTAVIGALGAGLTAVPWNSSWDAEVQSECADALTAYDPPTKAEMDTAHALLATPAQVATELGTYDAPTKAEMDTAHALLATEAKQDTIDTVVDGIQTDLSNATDGLGALKTLIDTVDTVVDAVLVDTAVIGALGAGLTAIPWNSAWDTEVESEVTDSLVAHNLDHLCLTTTAAADMTTEVADNTILSRIIGSGDTSTFDPTTDSLQDIRDNAAGVTKNVALSNFEFLMVLSSNHVTPATGKTITSEISKDGGAFAACTNSVSEVSDGIYKISLTQTEMNADVITLKFTETDCDQRTVTILTS